ncbi:MAG: hypothetical protein R2795_06695 [Saprospiraceae bacterium]
MDVWGGTAGVMRYFGVHPETANLSTASTDLVTYYGNVIPAGTTFRGNITDFGAGYIFALDIDYYTDLGGGFGPVDEQFVKDASWTRLRELSIGYGLPKSMIEKAGFTSLEFGITGRNLILWTDFEGTDPETSLTGSGKARGLEYFNNPGTRSILFNLRFGF